MPEIKFEFFSISQLKRALQRAAFDRLHHSPRFLLRRQSRNRGNVVKSLGAELRLREFSLISRRSAKQSGKYSATQPEVIMKPAKRCLGQEERWNLPNRELFRIPSIFDCTFLSVEKWQRPAKPRQLPSARNYQKIFLIKPLKRANHEKFRKRKANKIKLKPPIILRSICKRLLLPSFDVAVLIIRRRRAQRKCEERKINYKEWAK